jgi:hypothetical protein
MWWRATDGRVGVGCLMVVVVVVWVVEEEEEDNTQTRQGRGKPTGELPMECEMKRGGGLDQPGPLP